MQYKVFSFHTRAILFLEADKKIALMSHQISVHSNGGHDYVTGDPPIVGSNRKHSKHALIRRCRNTARNEGYNLELPKSASSSGAGDLFTSLEEQLNL
jgi:hypothetical protein